MVQGKHIYIKIMVVMFLSNNKKFQQQILEEPIGELGTDLEEMLPLAVIML